MSIPQSFVAFLCFSTVSALYFHIGETEKKCFIEEIPDETMVVGKNIVQCLFIGAKSCQYGVIMLQVQVEILIR